MFELIQSVDATVLLWVQEVLRLPALNGLFLFFTHLGDSGFLWILLSALLLCFKKTRKVGLAALFAMLLGLLCNNVILKNLVARPRPYETLAAALPLYLEGDPRSFPSGHTCAAFAAAGVWIRGLPKRWMGGVGLALAVLMGFSRLYVGVHYPSDILVGCLIGLLCGQVIWFALLKWENRRAGSAA